MSDHKDHKGDHVFHGGIHPPGHKELSKDAAIAPAPVPDELWVPLSQHLGAPAKALVKPGDRVLRGQLIGEPGGFISANVHSPVSGTVKRFETFANQMGAPVTAVVIANDHADKWAEGCNEPQPEDSVFTAQDVVAAAKWAGLVGMGGATFPTHVKLSPPPDKKIDTLIVNGVECEPYLTADYRLMLERPREVCLGVKLLKEALGAPRAIFCIEGDKPDAYEIVKATLGALGGFAEARLLPARYPQGAEKQLVVACTGREVPSGKLPADVGACVDNVGTAHALYEACCFRRPLTERVVTISGEGVRRPGNFLVRLGTPARALLEMCGFDHERVNKLIYGGPMMGPAHFDLDLPIVKGTSGVVALVGAPHYEHGPCIRCGRCVEACPCKLVPSTFSILGERGRYLEAKAHDVLDCMECGACTYVCPSRRPIVQWIKVAKGEIAAERARQAAAQAQAVVAQPVLTRPGGGA